SVTIPTANGEIGILQNHAPLISTFKAGILSYTCGGKTEKLVISGGFVEVGVNVVSVLAEVAETSSDIDVDAARAEQTEVEQALARWG
ncbi:ATP synthase F1 subunit epsilon, partial [Bacillus cereus]|uniref:ATP synthase F1 subunit epsilon n=1 Tax=Bacillus cereus TaxID=1396 RepID=UPI002112B570